MLPVANITALEKDEVIKKKELEDSVISGIEVGKKGFQQAAQALLRIDELGLWRDEATSFDAYRQKFKAVLEDLDITDRHLNRLIAAEKCVQILRPIGLNISQYKESHIRPLTQLQEPKQVQLAYKRALDIAENEGCDLKAEHVQKAVAEIKPSKTQPPKPPVPKTYTEAELQSQIDQAIAESKIGFKVELEELAYLSVREQLTASQAIARALRAEVVELQEKVLSLESLHLLEVENQRLLQRIQDLERSIEPRQDWAQTFTKQAQKVVNAEVTKHIEKLEPELQFASFLRLLPRFSQQQKGLVYEQLLKSGFVPGRVAA